MSLARDAYAALDRVLGPDAHRTRQQTRFLAALLDDRSTGATGTCSLADLTRRASLSEQDCRAVLTAMGCEAVTMEDGREGWRRIKPQ